MTDRIDDTPSQAATEQVRQAVTRYADAWLSGDRAAIAACYHDDFTLHYAGRSPLAGSHRGKMASLGVLVEVTRRTNRKLLGITDIMAGPKRGALLVCERFERDGTSAEFERLLIYTVRDGLLGECWVWDRDQAAVDAFLA